MTAVRVLVIAPHPDDEVLGPGGTVARLARDGAEVHVVIVTKATPPLYDEEYLARSRESAKAAHDVLGVKATHFLSFPAAALDTVPHSALNAELRAVVVDVAPDTVLVPFDGDVHMDHRLVFASALVCCRPQPGSTVRRIYAYETLSESNWNAAYLTPAFQPNVFVDIADHLETKMRAMACYGDELKEFPHERSLVGLRALAMLRGATVGLHAAEAFVLIREVQP